MSKYQDAEASANPEFPKYFPDYHEVPVVGDRDKVNTQKTSDYGRTMSLDVANIDKNDKNTWSTIHKEIDAPYFV